jgi:serine/threonine protein kinase
LNRVGRYEVIEKLGQGGMGTVYKAFDPLLTRVVAVKVISGQLDGNPEHRERFFREARAAAQLSHRNIITIYDLGEQDGAPYLAMEYLVGRDLDQRLHDSEGMSLARKLELALSISEGLAHAHTCGLIHRDIKPANIFVTDDGVVKILDFGLARLITSELTRSNVMVGTVNYMAPEQLRGERADHRADIFSFGVLLYELLGGRKPFQGDSAASTMYKILHEVPEALDQLDPTLGPPLTTVVDRAMAKAREDRYQRMTDLMRDLEAAYEPMRGADRRVISRIEAALRSPARGSASSPTVPYDPDNSPTVSDSTVPLSGMLTAAGTPSPAAAPAARPPTTPAPATRRGWQLGVLAAGILAVVAWVVASRQAAPPPQVSTVTVAPAPPEQPTVVPESAAPPVTAPQAPDIPAPAPEPPPAPIAPAARETRPARPSREEAAADRARANAALSGMDAAKAAAEAANAKELAPQLYAAAEREEAQARTDLRQQRFAAASGRLEATATLFRTAATAAGVESEARAARANAAEELRRRTEQAARQTPVAPPPAPVAPPPPRPEPAPAPVAVPAPPQPTAQEAVAAILRRYTAALEQRDIAALKAVWPGLSRPQQAAVESEFANARSISVELASPRIDVNGSAATVTAVRHYSLHTRDGQQLRSDTSTTLTLRQASSGWVIESVSHRPLR